MILNRQGVVDVNPILEVDLAVVPIHADVGSTEDAIVRNRQGCIGSGDVDIPHEIVGRVGQTNRTIAYKLHGDLGRG